MANFVTQVKCATAMTRTDINYIAENVLIPLFAEVYGYENLKNLNQTEGMNFPAIDLADEEQRIAIQVTSDPDSEKIKETLKKFGQYRLYEKYDRLIVYILTEKQKTYSGKGFEEIIQNKFQFDKDKDILDFADVLKQIAGFQIEKSRRVQDILEDNFSLREVSHSETPAEQKVEPVYLNFVEILLPEYIYIAEIDIDKPAIKAASLLTERPMNARASIRGYIYAFWRQHSLSAVDDWIEFNNKVVAFHDLSDPQSSFFNIIDQGTVETFACSEFYGVDDNYDRVFKYLLRNCLRQKLLPHNVILQRKHNLFIFTDKNGEKKRMEKWLGDRENDRIVYERTMKNNKPDEILNCKHFAFRGQFKRFGNHWFLIMKPEWFFSFDGYNKNPFASKSVDWLKRKENNSQVLNHFRFLISFLKGEADKITTAMLPGFRNDGPPPPQYPFLNFGEIAHFPNAPFLDDKDWNDKEEENTSQLTFDFEP